MLPAEQTPESAQGTTVPRLESLGLSELDARTYLVLVTGPGSARDLADELGLSRTRASALLTGLTQRGLLKPLP